MNSRSRQIPFLKIFPLRKLNSNRAALDELIQKQNYRLAFWGDGDLKLNYRRFFAVSTLAAVRVEDEKVFNDVHALLKNGLRKSWLDGLRVDHPDGLRDPENYLRPPPRARAGRLDRC